MPAYSPQPSPIFLTAECYTAVEPQFATKPRLLAIAILWLKRQTAIGWGRTNGLGGFLEGLLVASTDLRSVGSSISSNLSAPNFWAGQRDLSNIKVLISENAP